MLFHVLDKPTTSDGKHKVNIKKHNLLWISLNFDLPESWVWIVFNKLWRIFNPHFFNQGTSVSQGSDFKGDEIVFVRPVGILRENDIKVRRKSQQTNLTSVKIYYFLIP